MKMRLECLNPANSTTRALTKEAPQSRDQVLSRFRFFLSLPENPKRRGEGGLRLKGWFKGLQGEAQLQDASSGLERPVITVVTVVFNCHASLERTIQSVLGQTYDNVELIVLDGGSTDGTQDIIRKYEDAIDYWVSEPDYGIYDAMNRGIQLASGTWLNFMNSGDVYKSETVLDEIAAQDMKPTVDFIYSDAIYVRKRLGKELRTIFPADHVRLHLNHQAVIYRRALHDRYGLYLVARGVTISDYLFFSSLEAQHFRKTPTIIAIYDATGVSNSRRATEQRFIVDYLMNGMSRLKFVAYFLLYDAYRKILGK
jgi:glycosyltransferase involved in cell wall biosynthesis